MKMPTGQEQPGHHGPAAGDVDPLLAGVAHHQRAQRKRERHREAHVAEIKQRRMDHHLGILQQRIQAGAVGRDRARERWRTAARPRTSSSTKKNWMPARIIEANARQPDVDAMAHAQHKSVGAQQKRPQQQRAFLAAPQRGKLVGRVQRDVGVRADVLDGKVVGERRPDQRERGAAERDKAGDPGAAGGLAEAVPGRFGTPGDAQARWPTPPHSAKPPTTRL